MDWDNYRVFLAVAKAPSVRAAAHRLGMSHSTVLRKLKQLEETMGTRLIEPLTSGVQLTQAGEEVQAHAQLLDEQIQEMDRKVTGRDSLLSGIVRISMPDILTHPSICPDFCRFHQQFPGIKLAIELSYSAVDLARREADIAVRFIFKQPPDDLVGRRVGQNYMAPYATQRYIDLHNPGAPDSTAKIIGWGDQASWKAPKPFRHLPALGYYDSILLQLAQTKLGLGIGYLPHVAACREQNLVQIGPPHADYNVWVLYHSDLRHTARVRAARDFLVTHFSRVFAESTVEWN